MRLPLPQNKEEHPMDYVYHLLIMAPTGAQITFNHIINVMKHDNQLYFYSLQDPQSFMVNLDHIMFYQLDLLGLASEINLSEVATE